MTAFPPPGRYLPDAPVGSVLIRHATGWRYLPPGTSGTALTSNGAGALPSYQAGAGSGDMILAADQAVTGVKRFAADTLAVKASGAFYTFFRTNATADRTTTLPNITGTLLSIDPAASGTGRIPVATSVAGSMDYPTGLSFVANGYLALGVAGATDGNLSLRSTAGGDWLATPISVSGNMTIRVGSVLVEELALTGTDELALGATDAMVIL